MRRHEIKDEDWERIKDMLPGQLGDPGVTAKDNRLFINAVLWIGKTGAPWRDLPERFDRWDSVWKRFRKKKGIDDDQALGRSVGGFSTKIHILVDALGNPVEFILTGGQQADVTQAEPLMQGHQADAVIADKAYDSDAVVEAAKRQGAEAVIPSKKNRKVPRAYDKHLYKDRKKVEWFINLLKQYRRVATRYEKTARNFLGFVHVASIMILLR
jgi:transposase